METNTVYVGVDCSFTSTGVAVISYRDGRMGFNATATFGDKKKAADDRHRGRRHRMIDSHIRSWFTGTYIEIAPRVVFVFEHFAMGAKGRICDAAELIGYLKAKLPEVVHPESEIVIMEVPPATLKKFTTGHGFADKDTMARFASFKYGRTFEDDNQCDAYCLARLGMFIDTAEPGDKQLRDLTRAVTYF